MLILKDILPHFDNNKANLAACLNISRQAVSQWPEDGAIPEVHELKLRYELRPGLWPFVGDAAQKAANG